MTAREVTVVIIMMMIIMMIVMMIMMIILMMVMQMRRRGWGVRIDCLCQAHRICALRFCCTLFTVEVLTFHCDKLLHSHLFDLYI